MKAMMETDVFNRLIDATKDFVGNPASRGVHQYIKMEFSAKTSTVTAIAVDGFKLSVEKAGISVCDEDFVVFLKGSVHLPAKGMMEISLVEKEVQIRCGECLFGFLQPEGEFLDWERALPEEPTFRIGFNVNHLLAAFKAAKRSIGRHNEPLILEFRGPTEPLIIRNSGGNLRMVLPIRIRDGFRNDDRYIEKTNEGHDRP